MDLPNSGCSYLTKTHLLFISGDWRKQSKCQQSSSTGETLATVLIFKTLFLKAVKKNWNEKRNNKQLCLEVYGLAQCLRVMIWSVLPTGFEHANIYPSAPSICIMQVEYSHRNQPAWQNINIYNHTYIICCNMLYLFICICYMHLTICKQYITTHCSWSNDAPIFRPNLKKFPSTKWGHRDTLKRIRCKKQRARSKG